ncbi:MAG: ribonuclease Y [Verrucomicrobia bacterium]|nr:ribonuclease Y [Verrucomicrobiota bacterium]MBS0646454.1 ribonuclease Y [Verrucomicrobiota bacterium]
MFIIWMGLGAAAFSLIHRYKTGGFQTILTNLLHQTELECEAKKHAVALKLQQQEHDYEEKFQRQTQELKNKQIKLDRNLKQSHQQLLDLERRHKELEKTEANLEQTRVKLQQLHQTSLEALQNSASLSKDEAKTLLLQKLELEIGDYVLRRKEELEASLENEGKKLLASTLSRLALPYVFEATVTTVPLPQPEIKGRIIGREGRHIRLLEQLTGVNYLLDESPQAVVLSSCDPIRREVAKLTLQHLLRDGRIHSTRIEEMFAKAQLEIEILIRQHAERAAIKAGVCHLHPELIKLLGRLHYCYSHGQNLLEHSIEVSLLMAMMASELKLNSERARRIGLLHDIGKAASAELEGSHAQVGAQLALHYEETLEVANAIEAHHHEVTPLTLEALLLIPADTISASRPGARSEALDHYIKRMKKMEAICATFQEVEKAYALQAGREVCVLVKPDKVSDEAAQSLARTLVKQLEKELSFTGKIKVTVIREKKVIDYAS